MYKPTTLHKDFMASVIRRHIDLMNQLLLSLENEDAGTETITEGLRNLEKMAHRMRHLCNYN